MNKKPIYRLKLERQEFEGGFNGCGKLKQFFICRHELLNFFEDPELKDTSKIQLSVFERPSQMRIRVTGNGWDITVEDEPMCFVQPILVLLKRLLKNRRAIYIELDYWNE